MHGHQTTKRATQEHDSAITGKEPFAWSAVIAGGLISVGLSFLLNMFNAGIGLTSFTTKTGSHTFAIGGFLGLTISAVVIMYISGAVSGYLAKPYAKSKNAGEFYGFMAWCVGLVMAILLASSLGGFVNTTFSNVANGAIESPVLTPDNHSIITKKSSALATNYAGEPIAEPDRISAIRTIAFVTFFLFTLGALAACFGGRFGMNWKRDDF